MRDDALAPTCFLRGKLVWCQLASTSASPLLVLTIESRHAYRPYSQRIYHELKAESRAETRQRIDTPVVAVVDRRRQQQRGKSTFSQAPRVRGIGGASLRRHSFRQARRLVPDALPWRMVSSRLQPRRRGRRDGVRNFAPRWCDDRSGRTTARSMPPRLGRQNGVI